MVIVFLVDDQSLYISSPLAEGVHISDLEISFNKINAQFYSPGLSVFRHSYEAEPEILVTLSTFGRATTSGWQAPLRSSSWGRIGNFSHAMRIFTHLFG